ncbi:hypothetical protein [Aliarcobacter butzleri]|uniref:hypothetical protein n=1 Tax=Aliarcobacter butzleri TaxID=28197 RepID=UPI00244AD6A4|nr:hypothetical protein [Aliarcobacter butzleri]MDH1976869.1 hypothetical protein [Aliarcobacter butzleri]
MSFDEIKFKEILSKYYTNFTNKEYIEENNDTDVLMQLFGISPELKRENRQYWGRELGMVWENTTKEIVRNCNGFREQTPGEFGKDSPVDYFIGKLAIDTKYRIGSGDAGTLKKFKEYGKMLTEKGYTPIFLILREDNLPAAITAAKVGGWKVIVGQETLEFIRNISSIDFNEILKKYKDTYLISR